MKNPIPFYCTIIKRDNPEFVPENFAIFPAGGGQILKSNISSIFIKFVSSICSIYTLCGRNNVQEVFL